MFEDRLPLARAGLFSGDPSLLQSVSFVSEEGHILTNRHVMRTPESKKKFMEKRGEQDEEYQDRITRAWGLRCRFRRR